MKLPHLLTAEVICLEATKVILYTTSKEHSSEAGWADEGWRASLLSNRWCPPPSSNPYYIYCTRLYVYIHVDIEQTVSN